MTENEAIERIKDHMEIHKLNEPRAIYITVALSMAISAIKEIQQYRKIGTVEECREAVEKRKVKEPIQYGDDDEPMLRCPSCDEMVRKISWEEFRNSGMLWWINMILHTFGLAIVYEMEDGNVTEVYPARTKYRGFSEKDNTDGYKKVSKYVNENASDLMKESRS